jgi:hypothetical protein
MDALRDLPSSDVVLKTQNGKAYHRKTDIFKHMLWYALETEGEKRESSEQEDASSWIALSSERVKEIIELNKKNQFPAELADKKYVEEIEEEPEYENAAGQDSISRMDRPKKKKKKKRGHHHRQHDNKNQQQQKGQQPRQQRGQQPNQTK